MARGYVWAISLAVLAVDQGAKAWITGFLGLGERRDLWPGFFQLTRVHNPGAAFGIFPQGTAAFLVTSAIVSLALLFYLGFFRPTRLKATGSALILGGALGNLVDRARLGYVIDLFALGNFTVFNVADAALVLGLGLLGLGLLRGHR